MTVYIPSMDIFLQSVANAITLGSLYALVAIGYTMVYGILRLINFAHSDVFMMSMYFAFYIVALFHLPWYAALILAAVGIGVLGVLIERMAYRPLREAPRTSLLISAIGVSYLLENLAVVCFSGIPKQFPAIPFLQSVVTIGTVRLQWLAIFSPIIAVVFVVGFLTLVNRTKVGMAMRALSCDFDTSRVMGININRVISFTFFVGSLLAAIGAFMWGLKYPKIEPYVGVMPGLKCFIAAVLGGIGNIKGAVLGALLLGFIEIMTVLFLPELAGYKDAFAFILLIAFLLFKPTGIMGEKVIDKV